MAAAQAADTFKDNEEEDQRPTLPTTSFDMDDSLTLTTMPSASVHSMFSTKRNMFTGVAKHTLGLILLLMVVFLWTVSNFLGSSIFADNSYAKPFFLTYLNTSCFTLCIIPTFLRAAYKRQREGTLRLFLEDTFSKKTLRALWQKGEVDKEANNAEEESFLKPDSLPTSERESSHDAGHLGLMATARLSLAFCILWFLANYFAMACLQYTTVASTTILTSTSSVWTLLIGALTGTEKFTWRKLCGVLGSLAGIVLISQVDLSSKNEDGAESVKRALDEFPDKTPYELALGDSLALLSALIYGFYTITLKRTTISALPKSIHMPTFFGLVGVFNLVLLLPLFPILHITGLEKFGLPPNSHIWTILIVNSISSLFSDICWAYAMVFTSPLVVTVGLSLTIPLSLIGEMIIQARFESWVYWIGAMIVVGSFVFVEREEKHEEVEEAIHATSVVDHHGDDDGEPGPAIFVEDYDETHLGLLSREGSPDLLDNDVQNERVEEDGLGHANVAR